MIQSKKAVSPLVATILLVIFSLVLGTVTMNLGKAYIEDISKDSQTNENNLKYIDNQPYQCIEFSPEGSCLQWKLVS